METPARYKLAHNVIAFPCRAQRLQTGGDDSPAYCPEAKAESAWEPASDEEKLEAFELLCILQDELKEQADFFQEMERQFQTAPKAPE